VPNVCTEVAFGLSPYLNQFALDRGAAPYWKWTQEGITQQPTVPGNMHNAVEEVAQKARSGQLIAIHFNLDGISNPVASADFAAQGLARQQAAGLPVNWAAVGLTNAELNAIRDDPTMLQITAFYLNGKLVPSPF
jgi:hypothetical protein